MKKINVLVNWGKSFVDENGSFYCGTTKKQKNNAVKIGKNADLVIYFADIHTRGSTEFTVNGGDFPTHNLVKKDWYDLDKLRVEKDKNGNYKTVSPELTNKLQDMVKDKKSGLIVPRHVFFQDYNGEKAENIKSAFEFGDVVDTFGVKKLDPQEFLDGDIDYIINAKHMYNGVGSKSTEWMGNVPNVPTMEMNALTLMTQKYGLGKDLQFDITGVVMGICVYQTASNIKQNFPKSNVNIIADACSHLIYEPLGIADADTGNFVAKKMCQQVGINYISTKEYLKTI